MLFASIIQNTTDDPTLQGLIHSPLIEMNGEDRGVGIGCRKSIVERSQDTLEDTKDTLEKELTPKNN